MQNISIIQKRKIGGGKSQNCMQYFTFFDGLIKYLKIVLYVLGVLGPIGEQLYQICSSLDEIFKPLILDPLPFN